MGGHSDIFGLISEERAEKTKVQSKITSFFHILQTFNGQNPLRNGSGFAKWERGLYMNSGLKTLPGPRSFKIFILNCNRTSA